MLKSLAASTGLLLVTVAAFGQQGTFFYSRDEQGPFPSLKGALSGLVVNQDGTLSEISGSPFPSSGEGFGDDLGLRGHERGLNRLARLP